MIEHVVLFKWKTDADPAAIEAAETGLRELANLIPGIVHLACGRNFSERGAGFATALVVRFESRAALDAYGPHPAHQRVVTQLIGPIRGETIVADFEI